MTRRWLLNGIAEAGCHTRFAFSTHHAMHDGVCLWCHRPETELVQSGAEWINVLGNKRTSDGEKGQSR